MGIFKRILSSGADAGLLALVVLFMYSIFYVFEPLLSEIYSKYLLTFVSSPDPLVSLRSLFYESLSRISEPLTLLAMFVYGLLYQYLVLVVIGWISKKRISSPENPFKRAVGVLIPSIILGVIILAPFFLLFALLIFLSSNTTVLTVAFALFLIFLFVYTPVVSPSLVSLVVDSDSISDALRNGVLVGRRRWFQIVLYMLGASVVLTIIWYLFGFIAVYLPWAWSFLFVLYQALSFILPLAVLTEVYVADTYGE
ncbi:MAG TPA: hypothetical protein EYH23_01220 [Euryarchaeota archaeon]|nr:hypothetical protein [Euryarchaeota archaeon]